MFKGQLYKPKKVEDTINEELDRRILLAKEKIERLSKELDYSNRNLETLENQRRCPHLEWETLGGHIKIESRCKKCGLIHMA